MTTQINGNKAKYYPFLDVLRAFSVLWVIFHHAHFFFGLSRIQFGYFDFIVHRFAQIGLLGVDVFFVISGFLITGLLIDEFLNVQPNISRFYSRRFFKIVPHYFVILLSAMLLLVIFEPDYKLRSIDFLAYLLFFQNYLFEQFPILAHTWSIAIEEHFYLLYPLILWLIAKSTSQRNDRIKRLVFVLVVLLVIGCELRFLFMNGYYTHQWTHVRFDALVFGCLIKVTESTLIRGQSRVPGYLCVLVSFLLYFYLFINEAPKNWVFFTVSYLAPGFLLIASLRGFKPFVDLENNKFLRMIGKNSYGIYLWHYILIFLMLYLFKGQSIPGAAVLILFILSVTIGKLSTMTIERHFLNLRNKWIP